MLPVNGLYGHIRNNNAKSLLLLAAFFLLFEMLVGVVAVSRYTAARGLSDQMGTMMRNVSHQFEVKKNGPHLKAEKPVGDLDTMVASPFVRSMYASLWWQTLIGAGCWLFVSWLFLKRQVTKAMRAAPVTRRHEPRLYNMVENLSILAGLPMPAVYVMETGARNALTAGLTPSTTIVAVSRGLLDRLDDAELEAVLAHEITHIKNGDTRLVSIASLFSGILMRCAWMTVEAYMKPGALIGLLVFAAISFRFGFSVLFWVAIAVLFWGCAVIVLGVWLLRHSIAEARDFMADAGAVELTKNPQALASALRKIEGREALDGADVTMEAMLFASDSAGPLSTHPSPGARIAALSQAVTGYGWDVIASGSREGSARISWDAISAAARRTPRWVASRRVLWPTSALAFLLTYGVASVVDPQMIATLNALWRMTLFGQHTPGLETAFGLPEGMLMGTFQMQARSVQEARARKQAAACFPLGPFDDYEPGSRPFTPVPTDDAAMYREGFKRHDMEGVFFAWRAKNVLAATMRQCPPGNCAGKGLDGYRQALAEYMKFRMGVVRHYDRDYGAPGLAFVQAYFDQPRDRDMMSDLKTRIARGQIDPAETPEAFDAIHLATEKPASAFMPCRSEAEWRASAFPASTVAVSSGSPQSLVRPQKSSLLPQSLQTR